MSLRTERVASLIKEEVGTYFIREFRDPAYGFLTVTEVHMTPDLRIAKIYVSIMGNDQAKTRTMKLLDEHKGEIRTFIGSRLRMKFTPSVQFFRDETFDRVARIEELIKKIREENGG
ncbi:MAG: ribosome-binding factor A [Ignavibacteria bacterium 13_1_40CM_2_61_4]|nr:MAG: ribosome-binding factor A [Ignavibacteria bacterium 13_1_40CM_2_61_4]